MNQARYDLTCKNAQTLLGFKAINYQGEEYEVIDYAMVVSSCRTLTQNKIKYFVIFKQTNYIAFYDKYYILKKSVKDQYYPSILGVACTGNIRTKFNGAHTYEYTIWYNIIRRCYDVSINEYDNYGGAGVRVCDRWLCHEYFCYDLPNLPGYSEWAKHDPNNKYHLDKDILQQNIPKCNRVYSPETCMFIPDYMNTIEARKRQFSDKDLPTGIHKKRKSLDTYTATYCKTVLGTFSNLDAAISQRNDYIRNHDRLSNDLIYPIKHEINYKERQKYRTHSPILGNKNRMCIEIGDERFDQLPTMSNKLLTELGYAVKEDGQVLKPMCRIMGDDRSDEFLAKIEEQMKKNNNE